MKINLNIQFKNLDGVAFSGDQNHMGKILANALSMSNKGNSIKLYDWAIKLFNKKDLDIDKTDVAFLKDFIETSELLNVLTKAQLIEAISKKSSE